MLFSSMVFLLFFLPVVLIIYFLLANKFRNFFLLLASLFFYAWGEPSFVIIMVVSILINYSFGVLIGKYADNVYKKKIVVVLGIIGNLSLLFYFKYYSFLSVQFFDFVKIFSEVDPIFYSKFMKEIILPIGISFFTFQGMSYLIDVYRGVAKCQKNFINLALYISLFPQLIAGPIVRYNSIEEQLSKRSVGIESFADGTRLFMIGLGKKVILANSLGVTADYVFNLPLSEINAPLAWLGILCYTFQIYFDFSGYSEMAIGIGKMFGFTFPINFNYPYVSKTMTEFWRRWHISLSTWFKDYLYIPLGGNRVSKKRMYFNLFIVFAATGIWHGANWTFVIWGMWHGLFLILEKMLNVNKWKFNFFTGTISHVYAILIFVIGWVFFRSETITYALGYIQAMFTFHSDISMSGFLQSFTNQTWFYLLIAFFASTPIFKKFLEKRYYGEVSATLIYLFSMFLLANSTFNPFLYFRF